MSLKGDKYETTEEVRFRLEGTVVLYDGDPVYITRVTIPDEVGEKGEIARVFFHPLPFPGKAAGGGGTVRKYLSSKKFDLTPFKMGYFNNDGKAYFVSRTPVRQNRQGLSEACTVITDPVGKRQVEVGFANAIRFQGFVDMVKGKYPSFKEVGDMLGNKANASVAVSRCFAFHIDHDLEALMLLHKGVKCGIALKGERALRLPPKFHFLRQEAEECRIPLA